MARRGPWSASGPPAATATASPRTYRDGAAAEGLVEGVLDRFGRIDGLVNNAGLTQVGPFLPCRRRSGTR